MTNLFWEKIHPYAVALCCALLWYWCAPEFPKDDEILSASLSVGAILIGFLATAKSLLMTLDTPVLKRLSDAGYIKDIASYMGEGIYLLFVFCAWTMLGYFMDTSWPWFGLSWFTLLIASTFAFLRVTRIMLKLFAKKSS